MSNIVKIQASIQGVRPCLWHRFGPDALPLEKQERTGVAGNDPEEWRKTVLATKDGQLYFEPSYIFGCLRDAARYTKKGKGSIQSALAATLQVVDERVLTDRFLPGFPNGHTCDLKEIPPPPSDSDAPVYLDIRSVRNPSTKARNIRYRVAAASGWSCRFTVLFDKTIVSRNEMQAVLNDAGTLVGLSDARSIGFGRFTVSGLAEIED